MVCDWESPLPRAACAALLLVLLLVAGCARQDRPQASGGILDLSDWSFAEKGIISLSGEWAFCWQPTLDPDAGKAWPLLAQWDRFRVPGLWRGVTAQGIQLAPQGQATYRLRVLLPVGPPERLSLYISSALSVCSVRADGVLLAASGQPGRDVASEHPVHHFVLADFAPSGKALDIVVHVSNHHNAQGGINAGLILGAQEQVRRMLGVRWISGAFMAGALLCLGLYHVALFVVRPSARVNAWFGLFCLAWSVATVFSPSFGFLMDAFGPALPWGWYVDLSMLPYGLTIPLMLLFYHSLFPKRYGKVVNGFFILLGALYIGYILLTPGNAYDPVLFVYFLVTRAAFLYLFFAFVLDLRRKEPGSLWLFPGYLALAYAEFDDVLFDLNLIGSADFGPWGVFLFILAYALFMSARFVRAYAALAENQVLRTELALRRETEQHLRRTQRRLAGMFDALDDALVAVNQSREIAFCNKAFAALTGTQADTAPGRPLAELFDASSSPQTRSLLEALEPGDMPAGQAGAFEYVTLARPDGERLAVHCFLAGIELEEEPLHLLIVRQTEARDGRQAALVTAAMLRALNANRQRILVLEESLLALESGNQTAQQAALDDLKALDALLEQLSTRLSRPERTTERRRLAVVVMNLALDCWAACTASTKADLAERSRIWNVYYEKDGYCRTQTLDRYLRADTLPEWPRWRDIYATAEFVLTACTRDIPLRRDLEDAFARLKALA